MKIKASEYKIIETKYVNGYGQFHSPRYSIKYKTTFLWFWNIWKNVKHLHCGWGDCYHRTTEFSSLREAQEFADRFIVTGEVFDDFKKDVIEHKKNTYTITKVLNK